MFPVANFLAKRTLRNAIQTTDAHMEPPNPPPREELLALVHAFPYWYQRIYLGRGVYTLEQPSHVELVWDRLKVLFPTKLDGLSVLDVGTNAGYLAIKAKQRQAKRVVGIESVEAYFNQAQLCREIWNLDIEYLLMDAHGLDKLTDKFDIVFFTGILYHLKNPLQVIEQIGQLCRDVIVVETEVISPDRRNRVFVRQGPWMDVKVTECSEGIMKFIERDEMNGDGSNWWVPDKECVMGMLRTAGFRFFSTPCYLGETRLLLIASKTDRSALNLEGLK